MWVSRYGHDQLELGIVLERVPKFIDLLSESWTSRYWVGNTVECRQQIPSSRTCLVDRGREVGRRCKWEGKGRWARGGEVEVEQWSPAM